MKDIFVYKYNNLLYYKSKSRLYVLQLTIIKLIHHFTALGVAAVNSRKNVDDKSRSHKILDDIDISYIATKFKVDHFLFSVSSV